MSKIILFMLMIMFMIAIMIGGENFIFNLGGAFMFFLLVSIFIYYSIIYVSIKEELYLISIISMLLIFFNYFALVELKGIYPFKVVFFMQIAIIIAITVTFCVLVKSLFDSNALKIKKSQDEQIIPTTLQKIYGKLSLGLIISSFFIVFNCIVFCLLLIGHDLKVPGSLYSTTSIIFLMIGLLFSLKKAKSIDGKFILEALVKRDIANLKKENIKKTFLCLFLVLLIGGAFIENVRGRWFLWGISIITLAVSILIVWSFWKYNLEEERNGIKESSDELYCELFNVKYMLMFITVIAIMFISYLFIISTYIGIMKG